MKSGWTRRKPLTFQQAEEIRGLYATGNFKQKEIADRYNVLSKTISQICNNEILTHNGPRKPRGPTLETGTLYKGMACYTKVLTDHGWERADQIIVGDRLVAVDGTYTTVVSTKVDFDTELYRVTFDDKVSVDTAIDHRWWTKDDKTGWKDGWKLKTTGRLIELNNGHHIPTCLAVPGSKWLGKDPYVIGLLIGDGSTVENISVTTLYSEDDFILDYMVNNHGWRRYKYKDQVERVYCIGGRKISDEWKDACGRNKAHFKSVPKELLAADRETRLSVLQGLMDTDGTADKEGRTSFASVSDKLSADVCYLVRSLGGKASSHLCDREPTGRGGGPYFDTTTTPCNKFVPFRLPRKIERCKEMTGVNRLVKTIDQVNNNASVCIEIDHFSHQFVIQDFIVVHDATGFPVCRKIPVKKDVNATTM